MEKEKDIVELVMAAKTDSLAADDLVRRYLPFIKSETARFTGASFVEDMDELSIAMFAFYEAVLSYVPLRASFISYAKRAIKHRLIDYKRKEARHSGHLSIYQESGKDEDLTLLDRLDTGHDEIEERHTRNATKEEIELFSRELSALGLSLSDIAENSPSQERTLKACKRALAYAKSKPYILEQVAKNGRIPITEIAEGAGVEKKTLERHRKYLVAIILAYTNGFEIIRAHLSFVGGKKEVLANEK